MRNKTLATGAVLVLGCATNADVILDQMSLLEGENDFPSVSQDFEPALNTSDTVYMDDFTVDALHLDITRVEATIGLFSAGHLGESQWSAVVGYRIEFYTSIAAAVASLTGDAGSQFVPIGSVTRTNLGFSFSGSASHIDMALNVTLPAPGTYWVAVMGDMSSGGVLNQHGIFQNTTNPGNQNATWVNPGGGIIPGGAPFDSTADASYRLHAIPEPGSMIALGIGVAALLARRRRKIA